MTVRRKAPKSIAKFPTFQTSRNSYIKTTEKVNHFINSITKNNDAELELTAQEINHLHAKGISTDIYLPGKYLYYEIEDSCIIQHLIEWPIFSIRPYNQINKKICFLMNEDNIKFSSKYIEIYSKPEESESYINDISFSPLIIFILQGSSDPSRIPFDFDADSEEYKKTMKLVDKIKYLNIVDNKLAFKSKKRL